MKTLTALSALALSLVSGLASAHEVDDAADLPLPSVAEARQAAVDDMADVLSEGIWTQAQAGRIAATRVEVSAPMAYRLAEVWTALRATAGEWGQDVCWVEQVATSSGVRWVGVCQLWTE